MAITLTTGVTVAVAKAYGSAITITGITNAQNPVATTSAAHGLVPGDYIEISSGWGLLDQQVVRCGDGTTGSSVELDGINTSDTTKFAGGSTAGAGSCREITTWTNLSQLKSISASGGSQNFADVTSLTDQVQRQIPTTRAAVTMTIDCYDDPGLGWYADVVAADEARKPYGLKMTFPNGSLLVANAYWSLMRVPTLATNEALTSQISLSYAAEPVRYSSGTPG